MIGALNLLAFAGFTWGRLTESRRAEARSAEVSRRLEESERALALLNSQRETVEANARDMKAFDEEVLQPLESDLLGVQRDIDAMVRAAGLRARNTSYGVERIRGVDFVRCAIEMPLEGSYRNIVDLVRRIESSDRFLTIESLSLSRGEGGARLQLRVFAYFSAEGFGA